MAGKFGATEIWCRGNIGKHRRIHPERKRVLRFRIVRFIYNANPSDDGSISRVSRPPTRLSLLASPELIVLPRSIRLFALPTRPRQLFVVWMWGCSMMAISGAMAGDPSSESRGEFFESRIRPVLHEHCYSCHSADSKILRGGLRLDDADSARKGGDSGPSVVPGDVENSLIISALRYDGFEMPPKGKLPEATVRDFEKWIAAGAFDPRSADPAPTAPSRVDPNRSRDHWAFQRIRDPHVPKVDNAWVTNPIDAFVYEKLKTKGWQPASATDRHTWLRRATFDLIGLPPTKAEIEAFVQDRRPDRYRKVVDRLLASPHYGQRWGRHWLDLVRYADTNGADENHKMPNAWRYRDWVFGAFNQDLPWDQFVEHQLAGDLLPRPEDDHAYGQRLTATGMLVLGPKMLAEQDKEKMRIDIVDEQIDTVSKTFLGMTIACARCHDHKFDPISASDYYALAGIFSSTRSMLNEDFVSKWMERDIPSKKIDRLRQEYQPKIELAQKRVADTVASADRELLARLGTDTLPKKPGDQYSDSFKKEIKDAENSLAAIRDAMPKYVSVMAVSDSEPRDLPIHLRGNHLKVAESKTPRGVPKRLFDVVPLSSISDQQSGRLQMARWLTSPDQPLTARVMANRIWMWHFGEPLMRSPSNFGLQSERPEHDQLLDWLASRLMDGWSVKRLHRLIMTSSTYRMSSRDDRYSEIDPENKLLWRQNRRRLEVEPLCDSIRMVGGSLDRSFGGPPTDIQSPRRAVYVSINRAALLDLFSTFDYVETANHIERRPVTTVPNQALFLMNHWLVHQQANQVARIVLSESPDDRKRVQALWIRLFGRPVTDDETELALSFVNRALSQLTDDSDRTHQAWASLSRTLIAGSAFSYVD